MDESEMPVLLSSKPLTSLLSHLNKIALTSDKVTIRRIIPGNYDFMSISTPYCTFRKSEVNEWFIKETSISGIHINNKKLNNGDEVKISDGDIIKFDPNAEFEYKFCNPKESYEIPCKRIKSKSELDLLERFEAKIQEQEEISKREKQELQEALRKEKAQEKLLQSALNKVGEIMENELQCSICTELFIEALTLNCSHTFCKYCITTWKKTKKDCAICRAPITAENRSIVLDSFIEKMVQNLSEEMKAKRQDILKFRAGEESSASASEPL